MKNVKIKKIHVLQRNCLWNTNYVAKLQMSQPVSGNLHESSRNFLLKFLQQATNKSAVKIIPKEKSPATCREIW